MKNLIRLKESRTARPLWPSAWAAAVLAAVAGAAGIVPGQGNAAPAVKAHVASHRLESPKFKHPKLKHGELTIKGTEASDKLALRLRAGQPGILQVDAGDDGSADFSFARRRVARIAVDAGAGDDLVRIDESNGVFTDSIPTTIDGGDGNDNLAGGSGAETLLGGDGNDSIDGNGGNDAAFMGAGDDTFVWDPGDGSDTIEGQAGTDTMRFNGANASARRAPTRCASTAQTLRNRSMCRRTETGSSSSASRATSRWTPPAWSGSTSTPSAAPTSSPSTT